MENKLTQQQAEYFKNSKVRDKEGNLLVCYHGTSNPGFKEFDATKGNSKFGKYKFGNANVNYFTTNRKAAATYTHLKYERDGNVYACYINIENPYVVNNTTTSDMKSSFNIKDDYIRQHEIKLFDNFVKKYKNRYLEDINIEQLNKDLNKLNCELRLEDDYYVIYRLGNNSLYGMEQPILSYREYDRILDDEYDLEDFKGYVIGEDADDYFFTTDDIVRYVLSLNEEGANYDGIIIEDIFDAADMFVSNGTDVITLKSSNQIKLIDNLEPTSSNRIDEHITKSVEDVKDDYYESSEVYFIDNDSDMLKFINNKGWKEYRIFYDSEKHLYIVGKPDEYIHLNLIVMAKRNGYYEENDSTTNIFSKGVKMYVSKNGTFSPEYEDDNWEKGEFKVDDNTWYIAMNIDNSLEEVPFYNNSKIDEKLEDNTTKLRKATPYMLRNDGELLTCGDVHPYIKQFVGDNAIDSINQLLKYSSFISWFYNNTHSENTKSLIESFVISLYNLKDISQFKEYNFSEVLEKLIKELNLDKTISNVVSSKEELLELYEELSKTTNQEFCRVRTSSLKFGGDSNEVYFRISSIHFNWFPLIWNVVMNNKDFVKDISVTKDSQTFGGKFQWYKVNGVELSHISTEDFLTLKGNPVIEEYSNNLEIINEAFKELYRGKTISETYNFCHPIYVNGYYSVDIEDGGLEYDINNILNNEFNRKFLQEKIVKKGNKYQVQSEKGRNLGTYDTKEEAEKRLKQVEYFKSLDSNMLYESQEEKVKTKSGLEFRIWTESTGGNGDQSDFMKIAYIGDTWIDSHDRIIKENILGYLDYSEYKDEVYIQMINVAEKYQRKGVATALIESLYKEYPNSEIHWGYTTEDGTKLHKSLLNKKIISEKLIDREKNIHVFTNPYDVKNLVSRNNKSYRILYDANTNLYLVGDHSETIHIEMLNTAIEQGYYSDINWWEAYEYFDEAIDDETITIIIYAPLDKIKYTYGSELDEDGYNDYYLYNNFVITTRDGNWYNCPLSKVFGEYNKHVTLSKAKEDEFGNWTRDKIEVESLNEDLKDLENEYEDLSKKEKDMYIYINSLRNERNKYDSKSNKFSLIQNEIDIEMSKYSLLLDELSELEKTINNEKRNIQVDDAIKKNSALITNKNLKNFVQKIIYSKPQYEILRLGEIETSKEIKDDSPQFILPDGTIINVKDNDGEIHDHLIRTLIERIFENTFEDVAFASDVYYSNIIDDFLKELGWVRVNTGTGAVDDRFYCVLPGYNDKRMTEAQYRKLRDFLDLNLSDDVLIFCVNEHGQADSHTYSLKDNTSDEIIKKIKRYYSSHDFVEKMSFGTQKQCISESSNKNSINNTIWNKNSENDKFEFLESLVESEEFDVFMTKSVYEAKNQLMRYDEDVIRIFIDESLPLYLFGYAYECIHSEMIKLVNEKEAYNMKMNDFDNKQICLIYVPESMYEENNEYTDFREDADCVDDHYDTLYIYSHFKIYSRYQDFRNFKLYEVLGRPLKIYSLESYYESYSGVRKRRELLPEAYLDDEEKFYDYKTSDVKDDDIFDTTKSEMTYYTQAIPGNKDYEYMKNNKNLEGKIVQMSPNEYYEECAKIFNTTKEDLIEQRRWDEDILEHLKQVLTIYKKKFPITTINYAGREQEGLHRMMVAGDMFGWDHKFPVLVIDWYDTELRNKQLEYEKRLNIEYAVEKALRQLKTTYDEFDDFYDFRFYVKNRVKNTTDNEYKVDLDIDKENNTFTIKVDKYEFTYDLSDYVINDDFDDDLDDLDVK